LLVSGDSRLGPVVVMAFNRPDYLRETLASIAAQPSVADGRREVHLFQDGAVNFHSGTRYAEDADIEASMVVFREIFPKGTVHFAGPNLGIGLNFDRAERYVFLERRFPSAAFFEDDMVLGPHYLATLQRLLDFAASPESGGLVGHVAAYGHHKAPMAEQMKRRRDMMLMGHAWGYGITRDHWLDVREIIDPYIKLISDCDYRQRPKARICGLHKALGLARSALSQDSIKLIATTKLGRARIMPVICQARYVGQHGVNFTPEAFAKRGYGQEEIFAEEQADFAWPTHDALRAFVERERAPMVAACEELYANKPMPVPPWTTFRAAEHR
jgi:hypothetical protein